MRLVASITIGAIALAAAGGCGEKDEEPPPATSTSAGVGSKEADPEGEAAAEDGDREEVLEQGDVPDPSDDAAPSGLRRAESEAVATARRYVAALDARDGKRACALLADGAIDDVKLPRDPGGCAPSLEASIGFRDPRGLPVWESAQVEAIASLDVRGREATVIPTVFTRFADRSEPSVEDDPIYMERAGDGWRVAKPSLTLYRAVGQEPPPEALAVP